MILPNVRTMFSLWTTDWTSLLSLLLPPSPGRGTVYKCLVCEGGSVSKYWVFGAGVGESVVVRFKVRLAVETDKLDIQAP